MPAEPAKAFMSPEKFRELVEGAGLKQGEAAELIGVKRQTVVRWLSGFTPISKANALLIKSVIKPKKK